MPINKVVIPVAGLGTRFLPATKALPKEMLPVVDKPAIQYVVEEAVRSGLSHILMVTGRNKNALENHFDRAFELEELLGKRGDAGKLTVVETATTLADIHYVRQGDSLGLGHAISKARTFVGNEAFAVMLGDDLIQEDEMLLQQMMQVAETYNAHVVALMEVPKDDVDRYGIATVSKSAGTMHFPIHELEEKPDRENAKSNMAVIGRYVLQPEIFEILQNLPPGLGGEIQLTDALNQVAKSPLCKPVIGVLFAGKRFDTGDKLSYLKAIVEIASGRKDIGVDFSIWLNEFVRKDLLD